MVDGGAEKEEDKASMSPCRKIDDLEDSDKEDDGDESKGCKR